MNDMANIEGKTIEAIVKTLFDNDIALEVLLAIVVEMINQNKKLGFDNRKYREGIEKIKEQIKDFKEHDMWDTANGMAFALTYLEVKADEDSD